MITSLFTVTAETGENVLVYRKGLLAEVLTPGASHARRRQFTFVSVPMRATATSLGTQEITTADGLQVKATAITRWEVSAPVDFHERDRNPESVLYLATQIAVRDLLAQMEAPTLLQRLRTEPDLEHQLVATVQREVGALGITVLAVVVRDVVLPGEVRKAAVELATAKARGLAQLEEARARTATLRTLANGAKLLDDHPALAQLQLVEAAPPGSTVVLKVGEGSPRPASHED